MMVHLGGFAPLIRVPFIGTRRHIPPRALPKLVEWYVRITPMGETGSPTKGGMRSRKSHLPALSLLGSAPAWSTASTATADWVLEERSRREGTCPMSPSFAKSLPSMVAANNSRRKREGKRKKLGVGRALRMHVHQSSPARIPASILLNKAATEKGGNGTLRARVAAGLSPVTDAEVERFLLGASGDMGRLKGRVSTLSVPKATARAAAGWMGTVIRGIRMQTERGQIEVEH